MAKCPGLGALVSKSPRLTRGLEVRFGIREDPLGFWQWVVVPDSMIGPQGGVQFRGWVAGPCFSSPVGCASCWLEPPLPCHRLWILHFFKLKFFKRIFWVFQENRAFSVRPLMHPLSLLPL